MGAFRTHRRIDFVFALNAHGIKWEQNNSRFSRTRNPLTILAVAMQTKADLRFVKFIAYQSTQALAFLHRSGPLTGNLPPTLSVSRMAGNCRHVVVKYRVVTLGISDQAGRPNGGWRRNVFARCAY